MANLPPYSYSVSNSASLYAVLFNGSNMVNASTGTLFSQNSANWPNAAIALSDSALPYNYVGAVPSGIPVGSYQYNIYKKAGSVYAPSDAASAVALGGSFDWTGAAFGEIEYINSNAVISGTSTQTTFQWQGSPSTPATVLLTVIRTDTNATILSSVTMTAQGGGLYAYALIDPVPGLTYTATISWTYTNGQIGSLTSTFKGGGVGNPYFTWQQFVNRYGLRNVATYSNPDTTTTNNTPNYVFCQDAFNAATDRFHDEMRGGLYAVPLTFNDGIVPVTVSRIVMAFAISDLYTSRGVDDMKKMAGVRYKAEEIRASDAIARYRSGAIQFGNVTPVTDIGMTSVTYRDVARLRQPNCGLFYPYLSGYNGW